MFVYANAKINLGLYVLKKRQDGFHDLESVFLPLDWADKIEIIPSQSVEFSTNGIKIPKSEKDNLCMQAYELLKKKHDLPAIKIKLNKQLPIGSGLGGGSADAAFVLKALNDFYQLNINTPTLEEYAAELGSDSVFFIQNIAAMVKGRGEIIEADEKYDVLKGYRILIVKPAIFISSKEAYRNINPRFPEKRIEEIIQEPIENWKNQLKNDFEETIFSVHPILKEIKTQLYKNGAIYAAMSGSGSSIYGVFEKKIPIPTSIQQFLCKWTKTM